MLTALILSISSIILFVTNLVLLKKNRTIYSKLLIDVDSKHDCNLFYEDYKTIQHSKSNGSIIGYTSIYMCRKCGNFKKNNVMIQEYTVK